MGTYLYLGGELPLRRVDGWTAHEVWVPTSLLPSAQSHQFVAERLTFGHPRYGDHIVYVDMALLDARRLPRPSVYERIGALLERQLTREKLRIVT